MAAKLCPLGSGDVPSLSPGKREQKRKYEVGAYHPTFATRILHSVKVGVKRQKKVNIHTTQLNYIPCAGQLTGQNSVIKLLFDERVHAIKWEYFQDMFIWLSYDDDSMCIIYWKLQASFCVVAI